MDNGLFVKLTPIFLIEFRPQSNEEKTLKGCLYTLEETLLLTSYGY